MKLPTTRRIVALSAVVAVPVSLIVGYLILTQGERVHLWSDVFATPIPLDDEQVFTSVEVRGRIHGEEAGSGVLVFSRESYEFNEFGDRVRTKESRRTTFAAEFLRVDPSGSSKELRRLYGITLGAGAPDVHLYLVLAPDQLAENRLVLRSSEGDVETVATQVLTLYDGRSRRRSSPEPLKPPFRLMTRGCFSRSPAKPYEEQFGDINIWVGTDLSGSLERDMNYVSCDAFGDPKWTTLMGSPVHEGVFRERRYVDPTGSGRKVYDFVPVQGGLSAPPVLTRAASSSVRMGMVPMSYSLVLARAKRDPHRLIVREGSVVLHVLTLRIPESSSS